MHRQGGDFMIMPVPPRAPPSLTAPSPHSPNVTTSAPAALARSTSRERDGCRPINPRSLGGLRIVKQATREVASSRELIEQRLGLLQVHNAPRLMPVWRPSITSRVSSEDPTRAAK